MSLLTIRVRVLARSLLRETTDRAAARTDMIGATAASDRADAGFGAVRKALCAVHAHAHPPEGRDMVFDAREALAWTGGGRLWHGRVRARSAVQENPRASCGTLCEECERRRAQGREPWTGYVAQIITVASSRLQLGLFSSSCCT